VSNTLESLKSRNTSTVLYMIELLTTRIRVRDPVDKAANNGQVRYRAGLGPSSYITDFISYG